MKEEGSSLGDLKGLKLLFPYLRPHLGWMILGIFLGFVASWLRILAPLIQGVVVKDIAPQLSPGGDRIDQLWKWLGGSEGNPGGLLPLLGVLFFLFIALRYLFELIQLYVLQKFGQLVLFELRKKLFFHLLKLPLSYYQKHPVGKLITRISNDVEALTEFIATGLSDLTRHGFTLVAITVTLFFVSWKLGLIAFLLLPVVAFASWVFRHFARKAYRALREKIAQWNAFLAESVAGMSVIHAFGQEEKFSEKMKELDRELTEKNIQSIRVWALYSPTVNIFEGLSLALILYYGHYYVVGGELSLATLSVFIWLVESYYDPVRYIAEKYNLFQSAMAAKEKIFDVLHTPEDPLFRIPPCHLPVNFPKGEVEFRHVFFRYDPSLPWVLQDISFHVPAGYTVALVGHTGAGKSTLIKLLLRFFDPERGEIRIDGIPLKRIPPRQWRRFLAVVPQEVFLFEGTILENIRLWDESIPEEKVKWACQVVQAHKWIEKLEKGYHTYLHEGAKTLSAGERQLLSFARALVREPRILILDEATALVDTETEEKIQQALVQLTKGRTTFVIAHRLSTVRHADWILLLEQGVLLEQGTHKELMEKGGKYYELYSAQLPRVSR